MEDITFAPLTDLISTLYNQAPSQSEILFEEIQLPDIVFRINARCPDHQQTNTSCAFEKLHTTLFKTAYTLGHAYDIPLTGNSDPLMWWTDSDMDSDTEIYDAEHYESETITFQI